MIIYYDVCIKKINLQGKDFLWTKPICEKCKGQVWGHGFVSRFFNSINNFILIKRWRCNSCKVVYICRPKDYWSRYQETIFNIFKTLLFRVRHRKWPPDCSRQRGGHWLTKIVKNAKLHFPLKKSLASIIIFYQQKNLAIN